MTDPNPRLPMVEIFQTVEGEGTRAGFPTTFVRVFNCNLRCRWCDTPYSYAPARPEFYATVDEIVQEVRGYPAEHVCLTGGEPLMHGDKSQELIKSLARIEHARDIHIETGGAIHLAPFVALRNQPGPVADKVRFILDYKLPGSGENERMIEENLALIDERDELKFVIADEQDFLKAKEVLQQHRPRAQALFSPVWETMPPDKLVALMLDHQMTHVKLSLQLHKVIWDPDRRGV
ncbi:MAG: radical SAM protein [Bacillaceae bacterium]|nr:radical SAM protein [Bacillaceae bacterium]